MTEIEPALTLEGARNNLHFSQKEVAEALGMSIKTYADYEKYRKVLRTDKAFEFAKLVRQPFDSIIFLPKDYETFVVGKKDLLTKGMTV